MKTRLAGAVAGIATVSSLVLVPPPAQAATVATQSVSAQQRMIVPVLAKRVLKEVIKAIIDKFKRDIKNQQELTAFVNDALASEWAQLTNDDMRLIKYHAILVQEKLNYNADGLECDDCDLDGDGDADAADDDGVNGPYVDIPESEVADRDGAVFNEDGTLVFTTSSGDRFVYRLLIAERGDLKVPIRENYNPNAIPPKPPMRHELGIKTEGDWRLIEGTWGGSHTYRFADYSKPNPRWKGDLKLDPLNR
ncbi:hypothetical protein ABT294_01245 [Nonomuraea sp. NPDC000554]|uniref:hypothetical protein n=1 Tax=Nonomuraea sp. NPDC000554 TaxID=3154259 RepID=UPI00331B2710